MSIPEFLIFVLGKGARNHGIENLPTTIFLVGHFTRADIPAFADFKSQTQFLSGVRNTFLNIDHNIPITLKDEDELVANLRVVIRDTMLLTPQATKSLRGIGELVGFPKLQLDPDPTQHKKLIEQMDVVRSDTSMILVESLTGIRDIVEYDADLVPKEINKRLSMEYDWKRQPVGVSVSQQYNHVQFATRPWKTVDQFKMVRELWDEFTKGAPKCIKSLDDFNAFADHIECKGLAPERSKYLRKEKPDTHRLRQSLCEAWQHSEAGVVKDPKMTARQFAELLESIGIPCKRTDVENGKKKPFHPKGCPPTDNVRALLQQLKKSFLH